MAKVAFVIGALVAGAGTSTALVDFVTLQPATPGTKETGNINVSGTVLASKIIVGGNLNTSTSTVTGYAPVSGSTGVQGLAYNFGMRGQSIATSGLTYGGYFDTASAGGFGTWAKNKATTGIAIGAQFETDSTSGIGIRAIANPSTGNGVGGYFISNGENGTAGYFTATSNGGGTAIGVEAYSNGAVGRGVKAQAYQGGWFQSISGFGCVGVVSANSGANYGLYGQSTSPDGYGVFSAGNTGSSGTKSFRIDHPSDPEHKYLLHYSTESPTPQNFYSGNVTTDGSGYAWVALPEYFTQINKNMKYQLTVIGETFAQAIVSKEVANNRFQIRTSAPRTKVSWRVEADRNDLWVRNSQPKDVVTKQGREIGTYQNPELHGMPKDRGLVVADADLPQAARPQPK